MRALGYVGLACALVGVTAAGAHAEVVNWIGGLSGNSWSVAGNWEGGALPTTGQTAVIGSGTASVDSTLFPAPDEIRVDSGGQATFVAANSNDWVLNGGTFDFNGGVISASGSIQLTANSTINNNRHNTNRSISYDGQITEDGTSRTLTFGGYPVIGLATVDTSTVTNNSNNYSGGTLVTGSAVKATAGGALGTGPVSVQGGRLMLASAGSYTFGPVTMTSGNVMLVASPTDLNMDLQGGWLCSGSNAVTLDYTNIVTISNTVNIAAAGYNYNSHFLNVRTSISGSGKAVLNDNPAGARLHIQAPQDWTGGTEVKGIVEVDSGGSLPAGLVTVDAGPTPGYGYGLLRLNWDGAMTSLNDLVLLNDMANSTTGRSSSVPISPSTVSWSTGSICLLEPTSRARI